VRFEVLVEEGSDVTSRVVAAAQCAFKGGKQLKRGATQDHVYPRTGRSARREPLRTTTTRACGLKRVSSPASPPCGTPLYAFVTP
jgi:hypothetical protein